MMHGQLQERQSLRRELNLQKVLVAPGHWGKAQLG